METERKIVGGFITIKTFVKDGEPPKSETRALTREEIKKLQDYVNESTKGK